MKYVISDIHGCYKEYRELLRKIEFTDEDELYVLGDVVDRGPEPVKILRDMMMRINVFLVLGNHEYMMLRVLRKLSVEITEDNLENYLTADDLKAYTYWMNDGGEQTLKQFRELPVDEQEDMLEYIEDAMTFEVVKAGGRLYVLTHAGIRNFEESRHLDEYDYSDFLFHRADYSKRYYSNPKVRLVTGHTPTFRIRKDKKPEIFEGNGHIAIDCGCVYGGKLAAYCLDTGEKFYVDRKKK